MASPQLDGVSAHPHDDRDRLRCAAERAGSATVRANDRVELQRHKLARKRGEFVGSSFCQPALNHDAATVHVSESPEAVMEGFEVLRGRRFEA